MDSSPIQGLILFVAVLILNFIVFCFGEACQNANESEIGQRAEAGNKRAKKLLGIIDKPRRFITTVQLTGTSVALAAGFYQTGLFGVKFAELAAGIMNSEISKSILVGGYALSAVLMIIVLVSLGIIVPQMIGRKNPEKWALRLVGVVNAFVIILTPVTAISTALAKLILKIMGIAYSDDIENVTEEEIISMVNEGHEQGILEEQEAEMISNIIEMDEKEASEIMTHRTNVVAIDGKLTLREAVGYIISQNNSRFPVYDEDIDNIIGIVHIRDVFTLYKTGGVNDKPMKELTEIIREPKFIPETRNIDTLFREMQKEKNHMVIVIDEYGQTAGILTMEDILEEIVGNIFDEYDKEDDSIICESEDVFIIKGTTSLDDVEDALDIEFNEEDFDTLNGYLISRLERIPDEDEKIVLETEECKYEVLSIEGKMISLVRVTVFRKNISEDEQETDLE